MSTNTSLKRSMRSVPLVGPVATAAYRSLQQHCFPGSTRYWERRYAEGGTSGNGSEGELARFKASVLNSFVAENEVGSVVEFGCGDGRQLGLADYPRYLGVDVSTTGLRQATARFADDPTKSFLVYNPRCFADPAGFMRADLAMSLDVVYHLVEDEIYQLHLSHVFGAARRFVVLYTSDADTFSPGEPSPPHVRHRAVQRDVARLFPQWRLRQKIANPSPSTNAFRSGTSFADFFVYAAQTG